MEATRYYLVRYRPLEPYFFGNEHRFELDGNMEYYIDSEKLPNQTTLLGTLRFALMKHYHTDRTEYSTAELEENDALIGSDGFCMNSNESFRKSGGFGAIKNMSPLFLVDCNGGKYIPMPFDHAIMRKEGNEWQANEVYAPMRDYQTVQAFDTASANIQNKLLPVDFRDKDGLTESFVKLGSENDGRILEDVFTFVEKTGIQKLGSDEAFFKRGCWVLDRKFSFGVIVELDESVQPENQIVHMGQQKAAFELTFESTEQSPGKYDEEIAEWLGRWHTGIDALNGAGKVWYAAGDCFASGDIYEECLCALTKIRDFRCLTVKERNSNSYYAISRSQELYRLIRAGSFFVTDESVDLVSFLGGNENCRLIGMNHLIAERK